MFSASSMAPLVRRIASVAVLLLVLIPSQAEAQVETEDSLILIGLLPTRGGKYDKRMLDEAQKVRETIQVALQVDDRTVVGDDELQELLGPTYMNSFIACGSKPACLVTLLEPLRSKFTFAVFGDYKIVRGSYHMRLRLLNLVDGTVLKETDYIVAKNIIMNPGQWRKSLAFAFASLLVTKQVKPRPTEVTPEVTPETEADGVPVLEAITIGPDDGESDPKAFIDHAAVDEASRGAVLHGRFQQYMAVGVRGGVGLSGFNRDFLIFDDRLQLDFEKHVGDYRFVGRPYFVYDWLAKRFDARFREAYAVRSSDHLELSFGQRILSWGITDFWPVVDILNPRDFTTIRNWRPIDEKLPAPMLRAVVTAGRLSVELVAIPYLGTSSFVLDRTQPFALPIPTPGGIEVIQPEVEVGLRNLGGGVKLKFQAGDWQLAAYGLVGREPLPTILMVYDQAAKVATVELENERLAMAAVSVQGSLDAIDSIVKAEAAYYHRIDDACSGRRAPVDTTSGFPGCAFLRHAPMGRATVALERKILTGLDAHLQLIGEAVRSKDIDPLPPVIVSQVPGFRAQRTFNSIATLRLQGNWRKGDFRPMLFTYWGVAEKSVFVNLDLEYHVADGMALALGVAWFDAFGKTAPYTIVGGLENVSHVYLRGTAWF